MQVQIVAYIDCLHQMSDEQKRRERLKRSAHREYGGGLPYKPDVSRWVGTDWPQHYEVLGTGIIVDNDFGAAHNVHAVTSTLELHVGAKIEFRTRANKYMRLPLLMQTNSRDPRTLGKPLVLAHKILFAHRALPILDPLLPANHGLREWSKYVRPDETPGEAFTRIMAKSDPLYAILNSKHP